MFLLRRHVKVIAVFLSLNFISSMLYPTVSWALTAGPTAPEVTSFEPVDTTDMVNLNSGDFTYNIPLLEVPGPEGGYPLSLAYHAGITPDRESSWVGLGWSLSPGSINRSVHGIADDHAGAKREINDYWSGGETNTFGVGVQVGYKGVAVQAGMNFTHDKFTGFRGGTANFDASFGGKFGKGSPFGYSVGVGTSGISAGLKMKSDIGTIKTKISNGKSGISGSLSGSGSMGALGIKMSSKGTKAYAKSNVFSAQMHNNNAGKISTSSGGMNISLPFLPLSPYLSFSSMRYWMDENDNEAVYGSLYPQKAIYGQFGSVDANGNPLPAFHTPVSRSYDSYLNHQLSEDINDNPNPEKLVGGSFPDFDSYDVLAQGVSGSMRPFIFDNPTMFRRQKYDEDDNLKVEYKVKRDVTNSVSFRFQDDFANSIEYDNINSIILNDDLISSPSILTDAIGYKSENQKLAGSRNIEFFTNTQIFDGDARLKGFIDEPGLKGKNVTFVDLIDGSKSWYTGDQIGGFTITNESGVSYHYGLPVYAYDEKMVSSNSLDPNSTNYRKRTTKNGHPYAYTWLLTAVTGPDYIDRNSDGLVDNSDWGYWVKFDYGKWTDDFRWRSPATGMEKDIDNEWYYYSTGLKQLYYLNSVSTRSHTALFVKDMKNDGMGPTNEAGNFEIVPSYWQGELFQESTYKMVQRDMNYNRYPRATMQLKSIFLIENSKLNEALVANGLSNVGDLIAEGIELNDSYDNIMTETVYNTNDGTTVSYPKIYPHQQKIHHGQNVLDVHDLSASISLLLKESCLQQINLNSDYELIPETTNSIDHDIDADGQNDFFPNPMGSYNVAQPNLGNRENSGRLTLKSVEFLGSQGVETVPPINFDYDPHDVVHGNLRIHKINEELGYLQNSKLERFAQLEVVTGGSGLQEGDLISFTVGSKLFYCSIVKISNVIDVCVLGENIPHQGDKSLILNNGPVSFSSTKNAPYNKTFKDVWGYFKSDYYDFGDANINKRVTPISAKGIDCWSLQSVTTPTGADLEIHYESDTHTKPIMNEALTMTLNKLEMNSGGSINIEFVEDLDLTQLFTLGDEVSFTLLFREAKYVQCPGTSGMCQQFPMLYHAQQYENVSINSVTNDVITVSIPEVQDIISDVNSSVFAGSMHYANNKNYYGGGLRVAYLKLIDGENFQRSTHYEYEKEGQLSSGVTSFLPRVKSQYTKFGVNPENDPYFDFNGALQKGEGKYSELLDENLNTLINLSRVVPNPGVMYSNVTVASFIDNVPVPEITEYRFQTFQKEMLQVTEESIQDSETEKSAVNTYRDFTSSMGTTNSIVSRNLQGEIISEEKFVYADQMEDDLNGDGLVDFRDYQELLEMDFSNQGLVQEQFHEYRVLHEGSNIRLGAVNVMENYPSILSKVISIDHLHGLKSETINRSYDFYSGQVTESVTTDGYGNAYKSVTVPAYQAFNETHLSKQYPEMGLKVHNVHNRNMLSQEAESYVYKVDPNDYDNELALVSASVQTWSDDWTYRGYGNGVYGNVSVADDPGTVQDEKVWRKHQNYVWKNDFPTSAGYTAITDFSAFDWENPSTQNSNWQYTGEITQYDHNSKSLEAKDLSGNFATSHLGKDGTLVFASGSGARYHELVFEGAEGNRVDESGLSFFESEMYGYDKRSLAHAHTGDYGVEVTNANFGLTCFMDLNSPEYRSDKGYQVSVWVYKDNYDDLVVSGRYRDGNNTTEAFKTEISGGAYVQKCGDWYLVNLEVPSLDEISTLPGYNASVVPTLLEVWVQNSDPSSTLYIDDFRVQPLASSMTSYVYDEFDRLEYILNGDNFYSRFEYDAAGRLLATYVETEDGEKKVSSHEYNYAGLNE